MSKLRSRTISRLAKAGIAAGGITGLLLAGTTLPAFAAVPGTLSVSSGPSGGGNTITMTATSGTPFLAVPLVEFQVVTASSTGCSTSYKATATVVAASTTPFASTAGVVLTPLATNANTPTRLTSNKIVIPIPAGVALAGSQTSSRFYVCAYDTANATTSVLLSSAIYSIAAQPTIVTIPTTSGPALGGTSITVTGTGFIPNATTVTIGGVAATNVVVTGTTGLTALVPSHAPSAALVVTVSTTGGTVSSAAANGPPPAVGLVVPGYAYTNGIVITPNTSPSTASPALDITGAGFSNLTWAADLTAAGIAPPTTTNGARVLLTDNSWYNTQNFTTGGAVFPNTAGPTPVAQCESILPISDGEIICTLDLATKITYASSKYGLAATVVPDGTYQITIANTDAQTNALTAALYNYSVQSSNSTFTVASS